jgi:hypothetical protein
MLHLAASNTLAAVKHRAVDLVHTLKILLDKKFFKECD